VVVVTGTFIPTPLSENDRSVQSLDAQENPLLFGAAVDYLRLDPAVDLQERAPDGVQSDLSILGSTFAETLVLLNGLRLNDAQTAHHDMDIPVPLKPSLASRFFTAPVPHSMATMPWAER
jgi:hypothetical protein